jgi:hypothetical protein
MRQWWLAFVVILSIVLVLSSCARAPAPTSTPAQTPTPPPDTTAPSAITGLIAINAYEGRVNLWWDKSAAEDFDHYNIYLNKAEMVDVTGMNREQGATEACRFVRNVDFTPSGAAFDSAFKTKS